MRKVTDQMHRTITVPLHPQRIISLVPSQTELLYDLGLGERVVGITKFCVHPETWFKASTAWAARRRWTWTRCAP
jgi:ABC-type Fe3+-hydroxamate transport system substrate-binding protein